MVPTRPKKRKGEGNVFEAIRRHTGLTDILEWVGKASGIDDDVRSSFSEGDALAPFCTMRCHRPSVSVGSHLNP